MPKATDRVLYAFNASESARFQCRTWGWEDSSDYSVPAWGECNSPYAADGYHVYDPSEKYHQRFEVRAIDKAGNVDPTPASDSYTVRSW